MKISFALGHELSFPPTRGGGVNSLLHSLSRALAVEGHQVTAYSPLFGSLPRRETIDGVTHIRLKGSRRRPNNLINALFGLPYALSLRATLEPCDVLSCHMLHSFMYASIRNARVVTHTVHRDPKRFLHLFRGLDRIYTGSDAVSEQARKVAPQIAEKVRTVYNCIDYTGYDLPKPNPSPLVRFIFVGRLSEDKGVETLIRAFVAASKLNSGIELSLVGPLEAKDGGDEALVERCQSYIHSESIEDRIKIEPPIFDRARLDERIRRSDVVCLPSLRGETLNMSIIESMRLAKCLLVSDLPANTPLVQTGYNGFFAKTGDDSDWKQKILYLASNRDQLAELGSHAYRYGLEKFSAPRIAKDYVDDFHRLLTTARY